MEGSVGAPPQRVCPQCARISWATGPQCPYCTARFTRRQGVAPWMLVLTAAIVLLGVAVMLLIAGQQLDRQLDDRVDSIDKQLDAQFNQIRTDVRKELDARIPPGGVAPATPATTPTPAPLPTSTPTPGTTASPQPTTTPPPDTATPQASASPAGGSDGP